MANTDVIINFRYDYFRDLIVNTEFDTQDVKIEVSKRYFAQLVDDSLFLNCLRNQGVNNWDGWDKACEEYEEVKTEETK